MMSGLGLGLGAGARSIGASKFRFSSNAVAAPNTSFTISGVTLIRQRALSVIRASTSSMKVLFPYYIVDGTTFAEVAPSAPATLKATAEIVGSGIVPLTFNGQDSITVSGPTIITTDELPGTAFGFSDLNGKVVYIVQEWTVSDGATFPLTEQLAAAFSNESFRLGGSSQYMTAGALSGGTVPGYEFRQMAVLGRHTGKAILLSGDSISAGQGDAGGSGSVGTAGGGWMSRAASTNSLCYCKTARSGDRAATFKDLTKSRLRMSMAQYASHILCAFIFNDYTQSSLNAATVLSDMATVWANYKSANPNAKIYQQYLSLRTNAANSYVDLAGQTVATGWSIADSGYIALKAGIDAAVSLGTLNGSFDLRPYTQDPVEVDKFKVNGTNLYETPDGIHYSAHGYSDIAAGLASFLTGLS